ncbi:MAG: hypothetical protein ASARMPRED_006437 [Alectoria sarmentosa]|nr:MAG: hypothetical protein ASARMPRED_006437 [Alectoria sarmentosa]
MLRRQGWNTNNILCMGADYTYADALKGFNFRWNEWADSVETILHGIIDQIEELDISYDDYLTLVSHLASYPARPALPAADSQEMSARLLSGVWNEWADMVERVVVVLKWAIDHSAPLSREEQMLWDGGPLDLTLDLSSRDLPPMRMAALLRKMLKDGTVACDELAGSMKNLCL